MIAMLLIKAGAEVNLADTGRENSVMVRRR